MGQLVGPAFATTLPRVMMTTRSHTSSTSLRRCEFEKHRDAAGAELLEECAHRPPAGGVKGARGLVEDEEPGRADHRLGDPEPLLHALRHLVDLALADVGQPDELEQPAALGRAAVRSDEALVQAHHLVGPQPPGEAEELGQVAERLPGLARAGRRPEHGRAPAARADEPAADLDERRLARAVRAEETHQLALAHPEAHAVERPRPVRTASRAPQRRMRPARGESVPTGVAASSAEMSRAATADTSTIAPATANAARGDAALAIAPPTAAPSAVITPPTDMRRARIPARSSGPVARWTVDRL